ncbi:MAG: hypothetical protein IJ807_05175 [Eubacterium sp.]|nr:hypothetical protein [Eubacterium sp.]
MRGKTLRSEKDVTVTVTVKSIPVRTTATTLATDLVWTNAAQALITTAAEYTGGTVTYAVVAKDATAPAATAVNTWYAAGAGEIKKTDIGSYDVYMKVTGAENYSDIAPEKVGTVAIIWKAKSVIDVGTLTNGTIANPAGDQATSYTATRGTDEDGVTATYTIKAENLKVHTSTDPEELKANPSGQNYIGVRVWAFGTEGVENVTVTGGKIAVANTLNEVKSAEMKELSSSYPNFYTDTVNEKTKHSTCLYFNGVNFAGESANKVKYIAVQWNSASGWSEVEYFKVTFDVTLAN